MNDPVESAWPAQNGRIEYGWLVCCGHDDDALSSCHTIQAVEKRLDADTAAHLTRIRKSAVQIFEQHSDPALVGPSHISQPDACCDPRHGGAVGCHVDLDAP